MSEEEEWDEDPDRLLDMVPTVDGELLSSTLGFMFYALCAALVVYFFIALYYAFFGPKNQPDPYGNTTARKQNPNAPYKEYTTALAAEPESGLIPKLMGSVFKSFETAQPPPEVSFTATISSIPFNTPPARMAAGFAIDSQSGVGYMYGGFDTKGYRSDMYAFDTGDCEWREMGMPDPSKYDLSPGQRVHVRMTVANRFLVMFGGSTPSSECTDDLYVIDTKIKPWEWIRMPAPKDDDASPAPKPRFGHSICSYGTYVVIFGGLGENSIYLNDMWVIDTKDWEGDEGFSWQYVNPGGSYWPKGRDSHSMCAVRNTLVLFGGYDGVSPKIVPPGTIEMYDFAKQEWSQGATCGREPHAGPNCSAVALGDSGKVAVVSESNGGIFNQITVLDTDAVPMQWSNVQFDWRGDWTMVPGLRFFFCTAYDEQEGLIYVFGGKASGDDGMIHDTVVCANMRDAAGITEAEESGEEEEEQETMGDGWKGAKTNEEVKEAMRGTYLPGSERFANSPRKKKDQ